ncbi:hypothetical protein EKPJFOCH_1742 [Methylobacterium thuringiense]|uniref:Uncharacterized protein n=1 Tax=Methylobacterium thuringiense TaxID=1003091 RepID=A0ABQ4TN48_9HYPH|nr:hypothetical protein EKPJFOCH_1742 [Methylobacterium thuringiense]
MRMHRYGNHYDYDEHLRRMAEPEHVRKLRQQAERIDHDRRRATRNMMAEYEADRLRRQIRNAGESPVA